MSDETIDMFKGEFEAPRIVVGKVEDVCPELEASSFDAVLCDPPYGISFMCSGWDHAVPGPETWREVLRVAKPGAFLMAFGGTRLFHRTVCGIEDGGWEVRDTIAWMYGTGFPKSHDISKAIDRAAGAEREVVGSGRNGQTRHAMAGDFAGSYEVTTAATDDAERWEGYGTALKPAHEPICLAQKPREKTYAHNALTHGCGGLAIDASRIAVVGERPNRESLGKTGAIYGAGLAGGRAIGTTTQGRWPANVILDEEAGAVLDAQAGIRPSTMTGRSDALTCAHPSKAISGERVALSGGLDHPGARVFADTGGASRFFYCAKASRKEREAGLESFGESTVSDGRATPIDNAYQRGKSKRKNTHPTVKPIDLIRYLARLILPPPREDGTPRRILVPFSGSGSEVIGCMLAGWDEVVGIEMSEEYAEIARARIEHWRKEAADG